MTPGTYASFTIGATAVPSNLRILGDDSGPVNIATAHGPIQIMNVPAATRRRAQQPDVGSAATAQNGIVITNCACPIVLDEVDVSCDADAHRDLGLGVSRRPRSSARDIQGGTGLSVTQRLLRGDQPRIAELARLDGLDDRDLDAHSGLGERDAARRR